MPGQADARMGLERNVSIVYVSFFALTVGSSLWFSLFTLYLDGVGLDAAWIGLIITAYNAALSLTYLPSGRLSDMIGRRVPLMAGSLLLAVTLLLLQSTVNPVTILAIMVFIGVGNGLMTPAVNALVAESVKAERLGIAYAGYLISVTVASIIGSAFSGFLAEIYGYQILFLIAAALAASAFILFYFYISEPRGSMHASYSAAVKRSFRASVSETVRLLREERELTQLTSALSFHSFGLSMITPYFVLYAQYVVAIDVVEAGLLISFLNLGMLVAQVPAGKMSDRLGPRLTLLLHVLLSTVTWVSYTFSWNFLSASTIITFHGAVGAMDMPARRSFMMEYSTSITGKATIIGTLDAIIGMVGTLAPLLGGLAWNNIGYAAPFFIAAVINTIAFLQLIPLLRRRRTVETSDNAA